MIDRRIHLLWPTVRPAVMRTTYAHWVDHASRPERVSLRIAVNSHEERALLADFPFVTVVGKARRGATFATYALTSTLEGNADDLIVWASDDFFAPSGWDDWLERQFEDYGGAIIVDDGITYDPCISMPAMPLGCLRRLNSILLHPWYHHLHSDAELYDNLMDLGLLRDLRRSGGPVFEHRHHVRGKRVADANDNYVYGKSSEDFLLYVARKTVPLEQRLKVDPNTLRDLPSE